MRDRSTHRQSLPRARQRALCLVLAAPTLFALPACEAPPPQASSTAITADLLIEATDDFRNQLAASDWLAQRTNASTTINLQPDRVRNLSNERLTPGAQRALLSRILFAPGMLELMRTKNINLLNFAAPTEATSAASFAGPAENNLGPPMPSASVTFGPKPTHFLNAEFRSISRAAAQTGRPIPDDPSGLRAGQTADVREDLFLIDTTIVTTDRRNVVWQGEVVMKIAAIGELIN